MIVEELSSLFDLSKSIDKEHANLQTKTCAKLISMLEESPGAILGDDVGMGKTYIAFATAVYYLSKYPKKPVIIVTPNWLLNNKWYNDIRNFIEINLNKEGLNLKVSQVAKIEKDGTCYIGQLAKKSKVARVILVPTNIFQFTSRKFEKSFFLSCWFKHRRLRITTRQRILKALDGYEDVYDPSDFYGMGINYEDIDESWYENLDIINISDKKISKDSANAIWHEIKELRYKVINSVIPNASLLILDEAHKMKNEDTVKRQSLQSAINNKFDKAIFLTATPFQLGEVELKSIINMFKSGRTTKKDILSFDERINSLFIEMQKYKKQIDEFDYCVKNLNQGSEYLLEGLIEDNLSEENKEELNYDINYIYELYKEILEQKYKLENLMRTLIVRNVKKKDLYRKEIIGDFKSEEKDGIPLTKESYLPFAMMEKAIHEILLNKDTTFIASVKQSFTSSFNTATKTSIYQKDLPSINMLKKMSIENIRHPKINSVTDEVVDNLKKGEKTLIFCNRLETVDELKDSISKRLDKSYLKDIKGLFPEGGKKGFENYSKRFYNKQDQTWFLLQENYIQSVLVPIIRLCKSNKSIIPTAKSIESDVRKMYRIYNSTVKSNYMYLKRIIEHIVFTRTLEKIENWKIEVEKLLIDSNKQNELIKTAEKILDEKYISDGLSIINQEDDINVDRNIDNKQRRISEKVIDNIINYEGIWTRYKDILNQLEPKKREELVTSMIGFLRKDKRFFIELRYNNNKYPDKDDNYCISKTFESKKTKGKNSLAWENAYKRFLENYIKAPTATREDMKLGLKSSNVVGVITGETGNDAREKIKSGFNTPFYPQVLIATSTMQEGIDLQVECRRIIHYDLEWNPASMEQRVGRIDRINSLISKLREDDPGETLDVFYPYIKNTIDESIYRTLKDREKWFNLILGGTPQWDTFDIYSEGTNISANIFKSIQIDLSVSEKFK